MPFPERRASWIKRAVGNKSMAHYISEEKGLFRSSATPDQVHHIYPESLLLEEGQMDPNNSPAIPLGKEEHIGHGFVPNGGGRGRIAHAFEPGHSFHPDVAQAVYDYRDGNKKAFAELRVAHRDKAKRGEKLTNTDWATDEWYREKTSEIIFKYIREHPEDPPPKTKPHKNFKRKHWSDIFLGLRSYSEDE